MSEYLDRPLRTLKQVLAERKKRSFPQERYDTRVSQRKDPTRMERHEESYEDRLDDLGESPDY